MSAYKFADAKLKPSLARLDIEYHQSTIVHKNSNDDMRRPKMAMPPFVPKCIPRLAAPCDCPESLPPLSVGAGKPSVVLLDVDPDVELFVDSSIIPPSATGPSQAAVIVAVGRIRRVVKTLIDADVVILVCVPRTGIHNGHLKSTDYEASKALTVSRR
jgi:hypothetical protein